MSDEQPAYRVILQPAAETDIEDALRWMQEQSPSRATKWLNGLMQALESLTVFPLSNPLAPENDYFAEEIRQTFYGKCGSVYRILFTLVGQDIHVLHVRHGSRDVLRPPGIRPLESPKTNRCGEHHDALENRRRAQAVPHLRTVLPRGSRQCSDDTGGKRRGGQLLVHRL